MRPDYIRKQHADAQRRWAARHPEKKKAIDRAYYLAHREEIATKERANYRANREKKIAQVSARRKSDPEGYKAYLQRMHAKYPERVRARRKLTKAVSKGQILKPTICSLCHVDMGERRRIHAHHNDYSQPLTVIWTCSSCHPSLHPSPAYRKK